MIDQNSNGNEGDNCSACKLRIASNKKKEKKANTGLSKIKTVTQQLKPNRVACYYFQNWHLSFHNAI